MSDKDEQEQAAAAVELSSNLVIAQTRHHRDTRVCEEDTPLLIVYKCEHNRAPSAALGMEPRSKTSLLLSVSVPLSLSLSLSLSHTHTHTHFSPMLEM